MKKSVYILGFTFLGFLAQWLVHGAVEIWYIRLLAADFDRYSLGLTWPDWFLIHHFGTLVLLVLGTAVGYWQGRFWWPKIYPVRSRDLSRQRA
jgi:hypothetical protein